MKKVTFALVLCLICTTIYGQIEVRNTSRPEPKKEIEAFDSTLNFLGTKNVESYKGQLLFVIPAVIPDYGYENFQEYVDYKQLKYKSDWKHYGNNAKSSQFKTAYEDLNGKYFIVEMVEPYGEKVYHKYVFALVNKDNVKDKCYFIYSGLYEHTFPFLVVSHYNYLAKTYIGNRYVICNKDGKIDQWKCNNIIVPEKPFRSVVKMELSCASDTIYKDECDFILSEHGQHIFEKKEWDEMIKVYGEEYMNCVLKGTVLVGMPESLLYMSFGLPEKTNEDSYGEKQCVYKSRYVYIKNGKVTSWQSEK